MAWSIVEFRLLIPLLTDPGRFGADPVDAFTVVAPSLSGYPLSFKPGQRRFGIAEIADVFASLMTVLGYTQFATQGVEHLGRWLRKETGYSWIMGTQPQTLAYALTDSPIGRAAWMIEKFRTWSGCQGELERSIPRDVLLTTFSDGPRWRRVGTLRR